MRIRSYTFAALLCCLACGHALHASTFILGQNPNQFFDGENVGPYPGTLIGSSFTNFFCLDFTLTSSWGVSYAGTVAAPKTQQEQEVAFLGAFALYKGSPSSTPSEVNLVEGPISFAIWQIMGTLGTTGRPDPAAQPYIQIAQFAYTHNLIPQSYLNNVLIFTPNDHSFQRFVTAVPDSAMVSMTLSEVSEPGTMALLGGALVLLSLRIRGRNRASPAGQA
jgi:hypothetical protein